MDRIFGVIKEINSVALLLLLLGLVSLVVVFWPSDSDWERRGAIPAATGDAANKERVLLQVGNVENIKGAKVQMMALTARPEGTSFSSGKYAGETRNVLFLSGKEKEVRWLFPTHRNVVIRTVQLNQGGESTETDKLPTKALYIEFIPHDTDKNGHLGYSDDAHIALAKPDGSGFVEVLGKVSRVLSYDVTEDEQLSIVYQVGKSIRHARYSLESFKKEHEQLVLEIPSQL